VRHGGLQAFSTTTFLKRYCVKRRYDRRDDINLIP
jgi:hypothetical protein